MLHKPHKRSSQSLLNAIREEPAVGRVSTTGYYSRCEGYTDNRIRTDEEYIRNEANRQHTCIYIVWIYGVKLGGLALCYHGLREP